MKHINHGATAEAASIAARLFIEKKITANTTDIDLIGYAKFTAKEDKVNCTYTSILAELKRLKKELKNGSNESV